MRIIVFFVYLFLHLLCGSKDLHAGVQHNSSSQASQHHPSQHHACKSRHVKITNTDQGIFAISGNDLELDEEYPGGEDVDDAGIDYVFGGQHDLLTKWYFSFFPLLILSDKHKDFKNPTSFRGNSSPIYITQRVLRI